MTKISVDNIEELLEQGERDAKAKDAAKKRAPESTPEPIESSRDPRRNGRDGRDNRYSAEREENDQRRSRKSRDMAEDEEMKDASDKGSANGSVRSRRRSRSPDSDRRRHSSRDRHSSYRQRDNLSGGGDFYHPSGRGSQLDDRYRPGSGDRPRNRDNRGNRDSRERSPRRGDRDEERTRYGGRDGRDRRRSPERPRKAKTPEPTDDERDRRTVFVQQLAARLRTKELKGFFEQVGPVVDAQIVKDRVSGRSKGYVLSLLVLDLKLISQ